MNDQKFKIISYQLQDGGYGSAYLPLKEEIIDGIATIFSRQELGKYFSTKEEADEFTRQYLRKEFGVDDDLIES